MPVSSPESAGYDPVLFQGLLRTANQFYGDLNVALKQAGSPNELVCELQQARRELACEPASHMSDAQRECLLNRKTRITGFISQVRHTFDLPL